jgi:hypothetical protein
VIYYLFIAWPISRPTDQGLQQELWLVRSSAMSVGSLVHHQNQQQQKSSSLAARTQRNEISRSRNIRRRRRRNWLEEE